MRFLKQGMQGDDVELLQIKLKAAGYDPGDADGDYGPKTHEAVYRFQQDRPDIDDDGVFGPMTSGALDAAIAKKSPAKPPVTPAPGANICNSFTWTKFKELVQLITGNQVQGTPIKYGPGRGLYVPAPVGKFVITHGPGSLNSKAWKNVLGKSYPSFHCSSWTNFFLGWLLRYNEDYTHAGNIPNLFDVVEKGSEVHQNPGAGPWRGYGPHCYAIASDGSTRKRVGMTNVIDARELLARVGELPTFIVCGQSTRQTNGSWMWWHHTVLFVAREGKLFRIAADGYRGAGGYSAAPMRWVEITPLNVGLFANAIYRCYGVRANADGSYGDQSRPIAEVAVEQ